MKLVFKENEYKWDEKDEETKFAFLIAIGGEVFDIADDLAFALMLMVFTVLARVVHLELVRLKRESA